MGFRVHAEVDEAMGWFEAISSYTDSSLPAGHDVAPGLGWPTELEQKCPDWTEAFKGIPLRDTIGQPSRLVLLQFSDEIHPEQPVQYAVVRPEQPVQYAAVSYAWAQCKKIEDILCRLRMLMEPVGLVYLWIDQLCIDQKSEYDKRVEVGRMGDYYAQAAVTYVMVPEWSPTFTWELAGFRMSSQQAAKAFTEVEALETTSWASRVWTMQEAMLSGRTVFVGRSQAKSAAELAIAYRLHCTEGGADAHTVWRRIGHRSDVRVEQRIARGHRVALVSATHLLKDNIVLPETGDSINHQFRFLDDVWRIAGARYCSAEEDRVYGMLGLVWRGETVNVEYGIGFEEAVRRAAEKGLISPGLLLARTNSQKPGRCWCPAPGTESRLRATKRRVEDFDEAPTLHLTVDGLCIVQAARLRMPSEPELPSEYSSEVIFCRNMEGGRDFRIKFDCGVPEGEEWGGDWLAVVDSRDIYGRRRLDRATLIKYETKEGGILVKLQALEASIWFLENEYVREFLLG
ncbi:hypothetical protein PFICI_12661 [Pestalotiopsis fici W106-1]|uniref:Heterokaryon incompatibility domain-containing protein n=1 Tax=Pestalotiopsis fici (strain W106-1 / CGMCC3.15140) TaxID=1229662 RepID=W3WRF9_PESFW|nr:uncharacterized protein PFICI_12661 [Pestalotiopsis fici W106-1]ETS75717.1 hypothetical protein PFICI_12661 [Pestalotiopsis fici W106-1]